MGKRTCPPSPVVKRTYSFSSKMKSPRIQLDHYHDVLNSYISADKTMYQSHALNQQALAFPQHTQNGYPTENATKENLPFDTRTQQHRQRKNFVTKRGVFLNISNAARARTLSKNVAYCSKSQNSHTNNQSCTLEDFLPPQSKLCRKRTMSKKPMKDAVHTNKKMKKVSDIGCTFEDFLPPLSNREKSRRVVQFTKDVSVVAIPSHREYSQSTKRRLWTPPLEILMNRQRNVYEFRADGRNWRNAAEEEDMWMDKSTGEYIHPAHFSRFSVPSMAPQIRYR